MDELLTCLEEMQWAARQLEQAGQLLIGRLAVAILGLLQALEGKLTDGERQRGLAAIERAVRLQHEELSDELIAFAGELRAILRSLEQLRKRD